ncbi:MAG TPA: CARDB domain-containing protein [Polyangiaceae bacterium]|jgi:hypothetical protein
MRPKSLLAFVGASAGLLLSACSGGQGFGEAGQGEAAESVGTAHEELSVGGCSANVEPLRSIEIVHPNIVNDARSSSATDGVWSFRRLIENMAPSANAADTDAFLRGIFESWLSPQTVNGAVTDVRNSSAAMDRFTIAGSSPRQFNLANAPFKLIAIASRLDLRSATSAGEGRMIFGLSNASDPSSPNMETMTLIVEFALPLVAPLDTPAKWAAKWHELDSIDPATAPATFTSKLQEITDRFTVRNAFVGRPNGSAVNQIRTNEIRFTTFTFWQLREFNMGSNGLMAPATTKETPNWDFINQSQELRDFINQNAVLNTTTDTSFMSLKMPTVFENTLFLGSRQNQAVGVVQNGGRWDLSTTETQFNSVAIDNFGLLTCNGCHNENKANGDRAFYQVDPTASPGTDGTGRLSQFMLVGDPTKGGRRPAELTRRANDMGTLLCQPNGIDALVTKVSWSPANPAPGQATTFSATITNFGNTTKPAGIINGVAFRVDGNLMNWSDTNTAALAPGQSITVTANSGPSGIATWNASSGAHSIEAWVDDVNRFAETNENNNKLTAPLAVGVDVTVTNILSSPRNPSPGTPVTFSATVKNEGTVATPAGTIVGVRFEIDGQLVSWSDNSTASLAPGASRTVTASSGPQGSATWTFATGTNRLSAWVDDVNRLPDVNRNNNKVTTRLLF